VGDYLELHDQFRKGKKTRGGRPLPADEMPPVEETVTMVAPYAIDRFLGSRNAGERIIHLRRLRDEGTLIHDRSILQQTVRGQGVRRAYVFRGRADCVPRVEHRRPERPAVR
jgi:hypothetical protein